MDSGTTTGDEPGATKRHDLPDDVSAAGLARDKARRFVGRLRMEAVVEPLTLIVSELVSNAVRHGKTTHPAPAATGRPGSARGRPR
jgi:anti-sigma regulatory factor (Ser/Thr protein kinase)